MHMFSPKKNFYGGHGIVGAPGAARHRACLRQSNIAATTASACVYFGDGAANQGQVYESFNMAELWKLPVVYVIENNHYAMGTSMTRSSAQTDLYRRGAAVQHPGEQVDGMDVRAVKAAGDKASTVPRGQRPDHPGDEDLSLSRPFHVRSRRSTAPGRSREGAHRARSDRTGAGALLDNGWATEDELKTIDADVRAVVDEAAEFASMIPSPIWPSSGPTSSAEASIAPHPRRKRDDRRVRIDMPIKS